MASAKHIEAIYAWIATEADGGHGIPAMLFGGAWAPLIGADAKRIESMRAIAMTAFGSGCTKVELVKFSGREVLETHEKVTH